VRAISGWLGLAVFERPANERLEDREEDAAVRRDATLFSDGLGGNADESIIRKGGERSKVVVGLGGERIPVGQEEDSGLPLRFLPVSGSSSP
jgi:hypothetical protein